MVVRKNILEEGMVVLSLNGLGISWIDKEEKGHFSQRELQYLELVIN